MTGDGKRHPTDALAEYAAGVLDAPARTAVEAHLIACPSCRTALLGWTAVAAATVAPVAAPPSSASVVGAVLTRAALAPQAPPDRKRGIRFAAQLLRAELRLVRPSVWVASMLVMACAVAASRMPKPTPTGTRTCSRMRGIICATAAVSRCPAPVTPLSDT